VELAYNICPAIYVDCPVPPFTAFNVPARVTTPFVAELGVNPVVPALNDVTPTPPVISVGTIFLNVGTPADPSGLAYIRFAN